MATIPLPALHLNPPQQQENPLDQYARLLQLKNMQTMQPIQQQAAQQQLQAGQLDVQQKQQALKDQQAITSSMQNWDGKDYNDLYPLMLKNGASGTAVLGLKQKVLEQQQAISTTLKNNAEAGQAQMTAMKAKGDLLDGALSPLIDPKQTPDEKLPTAIAATAQDLVQRGVLDPQHAQQAAQLSQLPPDQIRAQLTLMRNANLAQSQIMEEAKTKAQTQEATSRANEADVNAQKTQQEMQLGTGPMADSRYRNILMNERLGRPVTPDDRAFLSAYEKQKMLVPTAQINLQAGLLNDQAKQMAAQTYTQTGQLPQGMRSPAMSAQILNTAATGPNGAPNIAANKATYAADAESLKKMQSNFDNVTAFENTAGKNLDQFLSAAKSVVDSGSPLINSPLRNLSNSAVGSEKMAAFNAARTTALTEIAKVLSSANAGSGVVSDSARGEVEKLIGPDATLKQIYSAANILKQDMANRHESYATQLQQIKGRMGGKTSGTTDSNSSADPFAQFGGKAH